MSIEDDCAALKRVLEAGHPGETYNIGGRDERTSMDVVESICATVDALRSGLPLLDPPRPRPPGARPTPRDRRFEDLPGRPPRDDFESGLRRTILWSPENPGWVGRVSAEAYRRERQGLDVIAV